MTFKILTQKERTKIIEKLKEQFGISEIKGILVRQGAEKIFLFQGNINRMEIKKLEFAHVNLERVGVYLAKLVRDEIRLSMEGVYLLKDQITKNIFELDDEQSNKWMNGQELNIQTGKRGFLIMKCADDFLGCGKASELKISNFIPKNRRLKNKTS